MRGLINQAELKYNHEPILVPFTAIILAFCEAHQRFAHGHHDHGAASYKQLRTSDAGEQRLVLTLAKAKPSRK
jgi:hypothetical protein